MKNGEIYQVKGWQKHFEGAKSKTYNNKSACTMPTKHGLGYRRLVRGNSGAAVFGAWCAMVQVLSRHQKPREGYCTDTGRIDGKPYTPDDLECLTALPAKHFAAMFESTKSEAVGWIRVISTRIPQGYHEEPAVSPQSQLDSNSNSNSDSDSDSDSQEIPPPSKNPYGEFRNVKLTDDEYGKLLNKHGEARLTTGIGILDDYIESRGRKYASHYAVLKETSWVWQTARDRGLRTAKRTGGCW